ncbi:hypothetical protein EW026_g6026 [Hermanssonia centrifuga]|uniref:Uncharacterized protein n=1 Tax=Hermanssonia centrifuga TaxID=98765 RepID=A0A4S4KC96_9APHY|nr:hypothetical protein EW026_g6026 [Hermanssonia centrifuga]
MAKTAQKKKQTTAPPPTRLSTRAKNANAHPGLVDISEESDLEKVQRNSKRKAVRAKVKEVKETKEANVVKMELLIAKLQSEIAQRDARENQAVTNPNLNRRASIAEKLASPGYSIEEIEGPVVPPSSPIERPDDNVVMDEGEPENDGGGSDPSQSPFDLDGDAGNLAGDMEVEETDNELSGVADVAVVPGGPLRRSSAAFFGRNNKGEVIILDRVPSGHSYGLDSKPLALSKKPDQPKKRKATAHEDLEDLPEAVTASASGSTSHGRTKVLASGKQLAKPLVSSSSSSLAGGSAASDASVSRASTPSPGMLISSNAASQASIEATRTSVLKSTATTRDTSSMNVVVNASTSESAAKGKGKTPTLTLNLRTTAEPEKPRAARVATQRLYEWRSNIGKRGIAAVEWLWEDKGLACEEERWDYVATHLGPHFLCMYKDEINATGAFQAEVLMRTFGSYLSLCDPTTGSIVDFGIPIGALAMCAAARGLLLYRTGKMQTEKEQQDDIRSALDKGDAKLAKDLKAFHAKLRTFSEGSWSKPTQDYVKVMTKLREVQWGRIMRAGMKHVKQSKGSLKIPEEEEDERAMMIVDSDDDGYSGDSE